MPETEEELLDHIKIGTVIHCTTAEQARAVLSFCREMGLRLYSRAEEWLDSDEGMSESHPNVGFSKADNYVLRYGRNALSSHPHLEFDDIAPILRGGTQPDYEIDEAVFEKLFPS